MPNRLEPCPRRLLRPVGKTRFDAFKKQLPGEWVLSRHWSQAEANAALPEVKALLAQVRPLHQTMTEAHTQMHDLFALHGDDVLSPNHPVHPELCRWQEEYEEARGSVEAVMLKFEALGVEVKDLAMGLVDFRSMLGEQEVFLCWREGEDDVSAWHSLDGGFARRRPIPDFTPVV